MLKTLVVLLLWALTAWLVYPLLTLDNVTIANAKEYLYRSAAGIVIMVIFLGKTLFDLFFPGEVLRHSSTLNTVLLSLYSVAIAVGIIFMMARILLLYFKARTPGVIF